MSVIETFKTYLAASRPTLIDPDLVIERATMRQEWGTHDGLFFAGPRAEDVARAFAEWSSPTRCAEKGAQYSPGKPEEYTREGGIHTPGHASTAGRPAGWGMHGWAVCYAYYPDADSF